MTHAMESYIPHQPLRLLAPCGVRYDERDRNDKNPTCPWCKKKLEDRKG